MILDTLLVSLCGVNYWDSDGFDYFGRVHDVEDMGICSPVIQLDSDCEFLVCDLHRVLGDLDAPIFGHLWNHAGEIEGFWCVLLHDSVVVVCIFHRKVFATSDGNTHISRKPVSVCWHLPVKCSVHHFIHARDERKKLRTNNAFAAIELWLTIYLWKIRNVCDHLD